MRKEYGNRVKAIGFSGHHLGIGVDIAAYTLGGGFDRTPLYPGQELERH